MGADKIIEKCRPCREGGEYLRKYKTLRMAWKNCKRGDWEENEYLKLENSILKQELKNANKAISERDLQIVSLQGQQYFNEVA